MKLNKNFYRGIIQKSLLAGIAEVKLLKTKGIKLKQALKLVSSDKKRVLVISDNFEEVARHFSNLANCIVTNSRHIQLSEVMHSDLILIDYSVKELLGSKN